MTRTSAWATDRLQQRINDKCRIIASGCWEWMGTRSHLGYGQLSVGRSKQPAHRISYEVHIGPVPPGLELDHLCRNRACVNPAHLEPVTHAENMRRSTHPNFITQATGVCKRGHSMDDAVIVSRATGQKTCRTCRNQVSNERRSRQRALGRAGREQDARTSTPAS